MNIKFKKIEIHSFMSFSDETFEFSEDGMILIRGNNKDNKNDANGCGKTNLWNAMTYALFGKVGSEEDDIKNEYIVCKFSDDRNLRVTLYFDVDGKSYAVTRGLAKGKSSYLELKNGETDLTKSSIAETQRYIEKEIISCDMSIFLRTVLLFASRDCNFYSLSKSEKRDFIEKLFGITIFGEMQKLIHKDALTLDKNISSAQSRMFMLSKNATDYSERKKRFESERNTAVASLEKSIKEKTNSLAAAVKSEKHDSDKTIDKIKSAITKMESELDTANSDVAKFDNALYQIRLSENKLSTASELKKNTLKKNEKLVSMLCDDCQKIFHEYSGTTSYADEIRSADEKIAKLVAKKNELLQKKTKYDGKLADVKSKLTALRRALESAMRKASESNASIEREKAAISELRKRLLTESEKENPYSAMITENDQKLSEESAELDKMTEKKRYLDFAEKMVSQDTLRKYIISDLVTLLNNRIKMYLVKFGLNGAVTFDSDMNYEFTANGGGKYQFGNFSAGEKMRITIATSFAFRDFMSMRNGFSSNILALDEYFDSALSPSCVETIIRFLKDYAKKSGKTIYCISHRQEVQPDMFDRILEITKENNISRICEV